MANDNDREPKPFSTDNLNTYGWIANSAGDKEISGGFSVWNGKVTFAVRRKGQAGRPMIQADIGTEQLWSFYEVAHLLTKQGPKGKIKLTLSAWDKEARKWKDAGVFVLGLDENLVPYFGISTPEAGAHAFPIRLKRPNVLGDEHVSKEEGALIALKTVCRDIATHMTQISVLTNQKRQFGNNNGGGNRGGGNRNSGGGGNNQSNDLDDDLPF